MILFALCLCVSALNLSCGSKPADLRAMMPGDSLVYLESNDLGAVMKTIRARWGSLGTTFWIDTAVE